jgi:hypothetical protein
VPFQLGVLKVGQVSGQTILEIPFTCAGLEETLSTECILRVEASFVVDQLKGLPMGG